MPHAFRKYRASTSADVSRFRHSTCATQMDGIVQERGTRVARRAIAGGRTLWHLPASQNPKFFAALESLGIRPVK